MMSEMTRIESRKLRKPESMNLRIVKAVVVLLLLAAVCPGTARAEEGLEVGIHGEARLNYRYGNVHGALGPGGIGIEPGGALMYDAGRNSDIFLPSVRMSLVTMYS